MWSDEVLFDLTDHASSDADGDGSVLISNLDWRGGYDGAWPFEQAM
jgi:hypothetical protein